MYKNVKSSKLGWIHHFYNYVYQVDSINHTM